MTARNCLRIANDIGAGLDKYLGNRHAGDPEPLIVIGLPRSGTTLIYELLVQAFHVAYFSKVYNFTYGMPNLTTRVFSRFKNAPRPRYLSDYGSIPGLLAPAENHNFWMRWFPEGEKLGHHVTSESILGNDVLQINKTLQSISNISGRPFVFKDVYLSLSLDALLGAVKRGKVLVIKRDHNAVAASIYKRRAELGERSSWWSIRPPFTDQVAGKSLIEKVAFQCVRSEQILEEQLSRADPARVRVVDYADVCRAPLRFLDDMRSWLGPTFEIRDERDVPDRFENRPSVGFPDGLETEYDEIATRLRADRETYLKLVAAESTGKLNDDQPGP